MPRNPSPADAAEAFAFSEFTEIQNLASGFSRRARRTAMRRLKQVVRELKQQRTNSPTYRQWLDSRIRDNEAAVERLRLSLSQDQTHAN